MTSAHSERITELLNSLRDGDRLAASELIPRIYPELRKIAARHLRRERSGHTLQPTALVHEAYLRIAGKDQVWNSRSHFFAVAAEIMRQILVDHARKRQAVKRGGAARRVELDDVLLATDAAADSVLDIDRAIDQLASLDPRQANIVVFRTFGGLTEDEIAAVLGVSVRTVKRDWRMARAWLRGVLASPTGK